MLLVTTILIPLSSMDKSYNFNIQSEKPFSQACLKLGINTFAEIAQYVKSFPYGRISNRNDYALVLKEHKGTCSTKHAFLKQIAIENNASDINLFIGIYKMNSSNTNGVKEILEKYQIDAIPEAHCYLKYHSEILDFTRDCADKITFESSLLFEEQISPNQIGDYKITLHRSFMKQWLTENPIGYDFETLWNIREECIANLTQ